MSVIHHVRADEVTPPDLWVQDGERIRVIKTEPVGADMTRLSGRISTGQDASRRVLTWVWPNEMMMEVER